TPERTLADLARGDLVSDALARTVVDRMAADERLRSAALAWYRAHPRQPHSALAAEYLRRAGGQEDVTR
ncbi:MAG: hypothetical protein QM607_13305, partial [Microbacterium sp.]